MSIEFFRAEINRPVDADGFELPPWENPYFMIPDQGEPDEADSAWLAAHPISGGSPDLHQPTDADWDDMAQWSDHLDRLDSLRRDEDADDEARARYGCGR